MTAANHCPTCICGRRAPVQGEYASTRRGPAIPPGTVSWEEHLAAYAVYAGRYGRSQSAEHLAARGGFGYNELTKFLGHEPKTWTVR